MHIKVETKNISQIEQTSIVQQSPFWSEIKKKQGVASKAFDFSLKPEDLSSKNTISSEVRDDLLVLLQPVSKNQKIAYVPYGPKFEPPEEQQGLFLEELSETIRSYLSKDCLAIRYDLLWESPWAKDSDRYLAGDWIGPPPAYNQEFRINFNTSNWNLKKSNTNVLPSDTLFIDLRKTDAQLLSEMKSKTRYNVRLSERKGVLVRRAGLEEIGFWYELYKQTCNRNKIFLHEMENFRTVLNAKTSNTTSPAEVELLIAELNQVPVAAMFLVFSGQRSTYLYGASSDENRSSMATYALQWAAIKRSREKRCVEYDMFGIAPFNDPSHPMYGLYRFKTGFGGNVFHRMGCWDYPLQKDDYELFSMAEFNSLGYYLS